MRSMLQQRHALQLSHSILRVYIKPVMQSELDPCLCTTSMIFAGQAGCMKQMAARIARTTRRREPSPQPVLKEPMSAMAQPLSSSYICSMRMSHSIAVAPQSPLPALSEQACDVRGLVWVAALACASERLQTECEPRIAQAHLLHHEQD